MKEVRILYWIGSDKRKKIGLDKNDPNKQSRADESKKSR